MQQVSVTAARSNRKLMPLRVSKGKHQQKDEASKKQLPKSEIPPLRVVPSNEAIISPRILQALKEDSDASESLSDIRGLLIGPVTRLHEARIEELLAIVEEADRGNRQAVKHLNARADDLSALCEKNLVSIAQTDETLRTTTIQQGANLSNAVQDINNALKDLFQRVEADIQQQSSALNDRVTHLAARTAEDHQMMLTYFTKRIDELEIATAANDERNLVKLENKLAKYAADMKVERTNDFESLSEGFADFSDRILGLRVKKTMSG